MEEKVYSINNLSKKQLDVIKDALDSYNRLGLLQIDNILADKFCYSIVDKTIKQSFLKNRATIVYHSKEIRRLLTTEHTEYSNIGSEHWSLGIGSPETDKNSNIAYELYKDITNNIYSDNRIRIPLTDETPSVVIENDLRTEKLNQFFKKINLNGNKENN